MATSNGYATRFPTTKLPDCGPRSPCEPAPVCPACGGLECLCRPRFFAGQLLTDEDLNRLDEYVVAKNRLHNRFLVGWGVACGLEVVCSTCDPKGGKGIVVVKPGYALSPCGNDIVVCSETAVNICDLIARCRPSDDMCLRGHDAPADDRCDGGTEEWILGICYTEKPSRGVTALMNATDPMKCSCGGKSGCGCGGGKSKCSCGGHGTHNAPSTKPPAPRPECEPTLTCESYTFAVWKAPKPARGDRPTRNWGAAARRFICCVEPFLKALGQYPVHASADELTQWYFDLRETVREFLVHEGLYDCEVAAKLAAATTPAPAPHDVNEVHVKTSVLTATYAVLAIGALVVQKCLCAALLPPCPETADTDCVPIATVTVKRRPCEVERICNISARKFLVTIPNIQYWLSFFSIFAPAAAQGFASFKQLLERLCCTDLERWFRNYMKTAGDVFTPVEGLHVAIAAEKLHDPRPTTSPFTSLLWDAFVQPDRQVNPATFMLAAMGGHDRAGRPLASEMELENPTEFLLAHQVVAPMLRAVLPPQLAELMRETAPGTPEHDSRDRFDDLSGEIAELRKTVEQQQKVIDRMKKSRHK